MGAARKINYDVSDPGKTSQLGLRLSLNETKAATIKEMVGIYMAEKTVAAVAAHYGVGRRCIDQWIEKIPELKEAMSKAREKLFPPR